MPNFNPLNWTPEQIAAFSAYKPTPSEAATFSPWGAAFEASAERAPIEAPEAGE